MCVYIYIFLYMEYLWMPWVLRDLYQYCWVWINIGKSKTTPALRQPLDATWERNPCDNPASRPFKQLQVFLNQNYNLQKLEKRSATRGVLHICPAQMSQMSKMSQMSQAPPRLKTLDLIFASAISQACGWGALPHDQWHGQHGAQGTNQWTWAMVIRWIKNHCNETSIFTHGRSQISTYTILYLHVTYMSLTCHLHDTCLLDVDHMWITYSETLSARQRMPKNFTTSEPSSISSDLRITMMKA